MKIGLVTLHSFGLISPTGRGMKIGLVTLHSFGLIILPDRERDENRARHAALLRSDPSPYEGVGSSPDLDRA